MAKALTEEYSEGGDKAQLYTKMTTAMMYMGASPRLSSPDRRSNFVTHVVTDVLVRRLRDRESKLEIGRFASERG